MNNLFNEIYPKNWILCRYKNKCEVFAGGTPSTFISEYWDGDVPWINSGKVQNCDIYTESKFITKLGLENSSTKMIPSGTPVLAMTGATCGNVGFLNIESTANQSVMAFIPKVDTLGRFVYYSLLSQKEQINLFDSGSAQSGINVTNGKNLFFLFPLHLSEQQAIANFLDDKTEKIDELISIQETAIKRLEEYKQSVITEAVTKGLDPNIEMKDSGIEWIGDVPISVNMRKTKTFSNIHNGLTYSPNDVTDEGKGFRVLRSSNVQNGEVVYNEDDVYVNVPLNNKQVLKNDILICSRNGSRNLIGKNGIIDTSEPQFFGAFMCVLRPFSSKYSKYIYYLLNSEVFNYYKGTFLTSTINQLTKTNLSNMVVPFDVTQINQIIEYLDKKTEEVNQLIQIKKDKIERLNEYKKSLIYEAVTGKIEVM